MLLLDKYKPKKPNTNGIKILKNISIEEIKPYIDWKPFFEAWELHGKFPEILEDEVVGKSARDLWEDAKKMLKKN